MIMIYRMYILYLYKKCTIYWNTLNVFYHTLIAELIFFFSLCPKNFNFIDYVFNQNIFMLWFALINNELIIHQFLLF